MELEIGLSNQLRTWFRRRSTSLSVGLSTTAGIMYLWDAGYKYVATSCGAIALGSVCWYWIKNIKDKIKANQAVIITGCDSGLGYSLALHCHSLGATVIAGVLRKDSVGAKDLIRNGIKVSPLDITNVESVKNFETFVGELLKQKNLTLRALVNNAGVMIFGEFEWQTEDQTRRQIEVNLLGTMRITKQLLPLIRAHLSRIIIVSSHCAEAPIPGVAAYGATKAGVSAWATALRVELKKYGVDVVCFVPGSFAKESNILSQQVKHFEEMHNAMTEEAKLFYGNYFTKYEQYLSYFARACKPCKLENPFVYNSFEGALLGKYPSATYKCEPYRYKIYHTLFKIVPTSIRDRLVLRFIQMPTWEKTDRIRNVRLAQSSTDKSEINCVHIETRHLDTRKATAAEANSRSNDNRFSENENAKFTKKTQESTPSQKRNVWRVKKEKTLR
ncbi:D-beta-hydroxybutyrate dehydrogenase, mitochondrial [Cephus cinctus]|uniref:D-beta-hydroxybutyrate dehydrogenase, mitochondrial n=1 Tax=Cephus cinctus TaxID=211228 RepID=A0AAJ7BGM3_CEPCN|nr:D-beta-hydroxybutyrate dehydrogenase, mitochondrial [Cephus cinctus]